MSVSESASSLCMFVLARHIYPDREPPKAELLRPLMPCWSIYPWFNTSVLGLYQRLWSKPSELKGLTFCSQLYFLLQAYRPSSRTPSPQPGSPLSRYAAVAGPTATAAGAFAGHRPAAAEDGRPSASAAAHGTKSAPGSVAGDSERAAGALHPPAEPPSPPVPHPQSYADVLGMLDAGLTPPGIRTDIQDKPPNPTQAPSDPKMKPRPKPWERAQQNSKQQQLPFGSLKSIFEPPRADSPAGARPAVPAAAAPT